MGEVVNIKTKKMRCFKFLPFVLAFLSTKLFAQQEAQFTQYNDNQLYYNPAYAGSKEMLNVTLLHRSQWVGIKGAPMTQSLVLHTPLPKNLGAGLTVLNDRVGPMNHTWLMGDLSYTINMNKEKTTKFSFGVKGGLNMLNANLQDLQMTNANDPQAINYADRLRGNVGAGFFFQTKQFFFGASVPMILKPTFDPSVPFYDRTRHFYLSTGGYFQVNRMLKVRPTAMLKIVPNAPFALDGSMALIFYDRFWIAGNYRFMESAGMYVQYQINDQLKVGYGYDLSVNGLRTHNRGTHEILLSFDLVSTYNGKKLLSPRFF
jgi:type IX secretion system PorP/SprF family membrane protein